MTPPLGKKDSLTDTPAPYLDMNPVLNALPEVNEKTCKLLNIIPLHKINIKKMCFFL